MIAPKEERQRWLSKRRGYFAVGFVLLAIVITCAVFPARNYMTHAQIEERSGGNYRRGVSIRNEASLPTS